MFFILCYIFLIINLLYICGIEKRDYADNKINALYIYILLFYYYYIIILFYIMSFLSQLSA